MNIYGLTSDIRKTVTLVLAVISLILGSFLFQKGAAVALSIEECFPKVVAFYREWEFLGVFSAQITAAVVFGALNVLFNHVLWKLPFLKKILGVPNLNGTWDGALESSYKVDGEYVKVVMTVEIKQTWTKLKCVSYFPTSTSYSDIVCIDSSDPRGIVLKFTYTNHSANLETGLVQFAGYNELRLADDNTLEGSYYTKREPCTKGTILLIRHRPKDDINEVVVK